ncbi:hypothetical protein [Parasphingorhabdus pacifica]
MTQTLTQPTPNMHEHVSELWREYERFADSDDPFDRTTARMLFNAAAYMDSVRQRTT